ncbi:hypothetical protein BIV60_13665 [Bacillus sp. MUM 116]|uniref:YfmQ family protein n=1 Tax=Bacillus sp. MUM 116 TaxID=1678002 RepID=UPI0008F5746F|nr:YfmQ family protein [Bacillus sp. MUM 116]OIK13712.1 hypothetical protein BIV60_13665 [Bacillus sp. MUM 116]
MTWAVVSIVLLSIVKILMTCLPTGPVEWLIRKFEIHAKLCESNVTITLDGKILEGENKLKIIHSLNEATFLKKYYIYPGTEEFYLHPENRESPFVIETKEGKKDVTLYVYCSNQHIEVVKQYKNKILAYRLLSKNPQKWAFSA